MNDEIIKIRERLVELSSDPIETRNLLDKLTEEEINQANIKSPFHVGENDIEDEKDLEFAKVCRTKKGYLIQYKGGYSILVNNKLLTPCMAIQSLIDGVPIDVTDKEEREAIELSNTAIEMIFRLPMFVFSNGMVMFNIAEMATRYLMLMQNMGEVPTEETENPEYDKFLGQMNDLMENFAAGMEKEEKEYAKRLGYGKEEKSDSQGKSEAEA